MNYRYDNDNAPENPDSVDEPYPSYIDNEEEPAPYSFSAAEDIPEREAREEYEQHSEDWREASYEISEPQTVFTPGLGNSQFYAPPRREQSRREPPEHDTPRKSGHYGGFIRVLCLVLVCAVIGAASGVGGVYYGLNTGLISLPGTQVVLGATPPPEVSPVSDSDESPALAAPTGDMLTGPEIYAVATQQVVGISTQIASTGNYNPFYSGSGSSVYGTGFIISEDGYILTNYHVVETAYYYGVSPQVIMRDGTAYSARIVGFESENDVAVLKIDALGLSPVKIGSSAGVEAGEVIYAVGNPNRLDYTITDGIVSALDREVQVDSTSGYSITMFQISAAVNSGNSGGPVYNAYGEVIGIVSAKYMSSGTEGLGFAIPIDDAMDIATDLITVGYVTGKAQLGITVQTMTAANAEYYGTKEGAFVFTVTPGSCAAKAGIKPGDVITKLDDTVITSSDDLKASLDNYKAGNTVTVEIYRDGEVLTVSVTFDEQNNTSSNSQSVDIPAAG